MNDMFKQIEEKNLIKNKEGKNGHKGNSLGKEKLEKIRKRKCNKKSTNRN